MNMEIISNNRSKIEYYDSILENIEEKLIKLKLEKNKIEKASNKSKKRIEKFHVAMNVIIMISFGIISSNLILATNMIEILIVTAPLCGVILEFGNKMISGIYESNNNIRNIDNKANAFKKYELEEKKKEIEDILVIRKNLNNFLENTYMFNFEKEEFINKISSNDDKIYDDFNIQELNAIISCLNQLNLDDFSNQIEVPMCKISNIVKNKEKVKIKN